MKRVVQVAFLLLLLSRVAWANQGSAEKAFVSAGQIHLNLSAGDYTIKAGRPDRIRVEWRTPCEEPGRVAIDADTDRKTATIATDGSHITVVIEVPSVSNLRVDLSAGDLRVTGITGNKDLSSWAGDIDVEVQHPDDYRSVNARVTAGDITARQFGVALGGLFRSFSWNGPGQYALRVRLTAGDLRLYPAETPAR